MAGERTLTLAVTGTPGVFSVVDPGPPLIDELFSEPTGVLGTAERRVRLPVHHEPSGKGVARSIKSEDGVMHMTLQDALQHEVEQAEHKRRMEAADPRPPSVDTASLREWLASWSYGSNWFDATGLTVPVAKTTLLDLMNELEWLRRHGT